MPERNPIRAPRGTADVVVPATTTWHELVMAVARTASAAGFGRLRSPLVEDVDLVRRVVGDHALVEVAGPSGSAPLALTPGIATSAARAFVQHQPATPWKVWSLGPRLARRADGQLRQSHEVGVQALGSTDPDLDVEVITVAVDLLESLGVVRPTLVLNSLGTISDRRRYVEALRGWLAGRRSDIAEADRRWIDSAPLRVLGSDDPVTRAAVADAPRAIDSLSSEGRAHLSKVQEGVGAAGIDYLFDHRVAGRSPHAVHVVFEVQDSAEQVLVAGERHEGLVEDLGGPVTPGVGWSTSVEGLVVAVPAPTVASTATQVFVVDLTGGTVARDLTRTLRQSGLAADRAYDDRSMRAQMKAADRSGATVALIVGEQEQAEGVVALRTLRDGSEEQTTVPEAEVIDALRSLLDG